MSKDINNKEYNIYIKFIINICNFIKLRNHILKNSSKGKFKYFIISNIIFNIYI